MRSQFVLSSVLAILTTLVVGCKPTSVTLSDMALIGGSQDTAGTKYPSAFYLGMNRGGHCTGTKIAPGVILTAGHCIEFPTLGNLLTKGIFFSKSPSVDKDDKGTALVLTKPAVVHPDFLKWVKAQTTTIAKPTNAPNVGLIFVEEKGAFAELPVTAVDLTPIENGESFDALGYGCEKNPTKQEPSSYPYKRKFSTERAKLDATHPLYVAFAPGAAIASICPADSGGPLFRKVGEAFKVVGVLAFPQGRDSLSTRMSQVQSFLVEQGVASVAVAAKALQQAQTIETTAVELIENKTCRARVVKSPTNTAILAFKDKAAKQQDSILSPCTRVCVDDKDIDNTTSPSSKETIFKRVLANKRIVFVGHTNLHLTEKCTGKK